MSSFPFVAIVILNWNGKHYLQKFLPFVLASTYPNYKVIVADNASTDDSISYLKSHFPQVEINVLAQNFGFAKGYNEALKNLTADYYVLLNSDVEVESNWLQPMIALLERNVEAAACQPKILSYHNKQTFEYAGAAGGWIDTLGYPFARGRIFDLCEEDNGQYNTVTEIFWASGAALVIRPDIFHLLGGFDPLFFAHQEEIDLCWRVQLLGRKIYCCPQSVVYHVGGGTLPKVNQQKTFLNFRNNLMMLVKNLPLREKGWKLPCRLALDQISAVKGLLEGNGSYFLAIINAHLNFFKWLLFVRAKKQIKQKPLSRLNGVYTGSIVWDYFVKKRKRFAEIMSKQ